MFSRRIILLFSGPGRAPELIVPSLKLKLTMRPFDYTLRRIFMLAGAVLAGIANLDAGGWKAASARVVITPESTMWLAGYASRDKPSEGKLHDLWAKVIVLEDSLGAQSVLVTADLVGFPRETTERIRKQLSDRHGLSKAQIMLNSSHTHSGPVLKDALSDYYGKTFDGRDLSMIADYTGKLEEKIVAAVGAAIGRLKPARVYCGNGVARFQVNRRNNVEAALEPETSLKGPNDYAVPVLRIDDMEGKPVSVVFGYACHPTVLGIYKWSGDYAGFAQIELEKMYPGVSALFFQGAGADQNPLPRRTEALAEQYGLTLAAAVSAALKGPMRELPSVLKTGYREIDLPLNPVPAKDELLKTESSARGYVKVWARRLIDQLERGESLMQSYPYYPVQVWNLGGLNWISLGGEVVVEYALQLKKIWGNETFVAGYSNDMMGYIPSLTILREGGYEGASSQVYFKGLASTWDAGIEARILYGVISLAEEMKIPKKAYPVHGN